VKVNDEEVSTMKKTRTTKEKFFDVLDDVGALMGGEFGPEVDLYVGEMMERFPTRWPSLVLAVAK
jgi:hypothetical protein